MAVDDKKPRPEREHTDESLRTEREETDRALLERQAAVEDDADEVVLRARQNADAVLTAARDKADEQPATSVTTAAVANERALEDEVLRVERATADETLRQERQESARALSSLLPLEREQTDRYLLTERVRSDDVLSHRDDFLGIVSHDLRSLLGGIVMNADLLAQRASKTPDAKDTLVATARIQRYAARMNRLIGDLVDVASIDAGKLSVSPIPGDATALIAEAVDTFQATAVANGIPFGPRCPSGPCWPNSIAIECSRCWPISSRTRSSSRLRAAPFELKASAPHTNFVFPSATQVPASPTTCSRPFSSGSGSSGRMIGEDWASAFISPDASWKLTAGRSGRRANRARAASSRSRSPSMDPGRAHAQAHDVGALLEVSPDLVRQRRRERVTGGVDRRTARLDRGVSMQPGRVAHRPTPRVHGNCPRRRRRGSYRAVRHRAPPAEPLRGPAFAFCLVSRGARSGRLSSDGAAGMAFRKRSTALTLAGPSLGEW